MARLLPFRRPALLMFLVCCFPATLQAQVSPAAARDAAAELVRKVASYSTTEPDAPAAPAEWRQATVGPPLLVHSYTTLAASYYLVPVESASGDARWSVAIGAESGLWQFYRREPARLAGLADDRDEVVSVLRREFGLVAPADEIILVMMPDRQLYWYLRSTGHDLTEEYFVRAGDHGVVHSHLDMESAGLLGSRGMVDGGSWSPSAPERVEDGASRYPPVHEIEGVPHHDQITPYYCSPAAVEIVFDYHGPDVDQTDIAHVCNANELFGTTSTDIRRSGHFSYISTAVQDPDLHGYNERAIGYGSMENRWSDPDDESDPDFPDRYDDLKRLLAADHPVIVGTWYDGTHQEGHTRVVIGYNDDLDTITVHDPWDGPDIQFNQTFFVDDLWTQNRRWGSIAAPWAVVATAAAQVCAGQTFPVDVIVDYPGPHPFEGQGVAAGAEATISPPDGFVLAGGEPETKAVSGISGSGSSGGVGWELIAPATPGSGPIVVDAKGNVTESAFSYPSYSDWIGGSGSVTVAAVTAPGVTTGLTFGVDRQTLSWTAVATASGYDTARGDLGLLLQSEGDFGTAVTDCLEDDDGDTSAVDETEPGGGAGFFYLVRAGNGCGSGSYDTDGPGQAGAREVGLCP